VNPLDLPKRKPKRKGISPPTARWQTSDPKRPEARQRPLLPNKLQALEDGKEAEDVVTIKVVGGRGHPGGAFNLKYTGGSLHSYFKQVGLVTIARGSAVYDLSNLAGGRRRSTYVPKPGASIHVGPSEYTPLSHYQRSSRHSEAMDIAANIGGGARVVEIPIGNRSAANKPVAKPKRKGIDGLDLDQI